MSDANRNMDSEASLPESQSELLSDGRDAAMPVEGNLVSSDSERGDRRPIGSRDSSWAAAIAAWLSRRGVTPNQISIAGMAAAIVAAVAVAFGNQDSWPERVLLVVAAALIFGRLLANMFDGMVAIEQGHATATGKLYNEIPDRISDGVVLFAAGLYPGATMELGLGAACVSLFVAYVRTADAAAGSPADFSGPMAKQQRMAVLIALLLFLAVAPSAWAFEWGPSGEWELMAVALWIVIVGGLLTSFRRVITAVRFLNKQG